MAQKSRKYTFTLNNWTGVEWSKITDWLNNYKNLVYAIIGKEVGESGTPHLQGYICVKNAIAFNTIKKLIPRGHIEKAKGTSADNRKYCSKDNDFTEWGELPAGQGHRTDLDVLKNMISSGETTVDKLTMDIPGIFHQYGRTLNKIEDIVLRKKFRTDMTTGLWYFGDTGVGKSHIAFKDFNPDTHYVYKNDNGWWDGYTGQETVIFNDFRGEIKYNELLQMIDKWPYSVKRRGREPAPFLAKVVIITSSLAPWDIFRNREIEDKLEQLMRRVKVYHVTGHDTMNEVFGTEEKIVDREWDLEDLVPK